MEKPGGEPTEDGRRRRWREHNQARRRVIIGAALAVLEQHRPGDEVQLQLIADRAGLSRTVIYRHFTDRADLDRAVQRRIVGLLGEQLLPALEADGTPREVLHRVVDAFLRWAKAHPTLLWFAERDVGGWGPNPLTASVEAIAQQTEGVMSTVVRRMGVELSEEDHAHLDPWVFGMIGAVIAFARRWVARPAPMPSVEATVDFLVESLWFEIENIAASRGLLLPDDVSLARLLDIATGGGADRGPTRP